MTTEVVSARTLRRVENKLLRVLGVIEERQRVIEKDLEQIRKYVGVLAKNSKPPIEFTSVTNEALARGLQLVKP